MAEDYFTKAEKIKQKVRNLDWEKKIKLLEKDFEDKKFSKEEFLEKKRQVYIDVLDQMSSINQEKMKLNKDHSAEPDQKHCPNVFRCSNGGGEDVQQITGPDVLKEWDGYSLLGAEKGIPENDGPDKVGDGLGEVARGLRLEVFCQESPHEELDEWPENEFDDPHRMTSVEPEIS